MEGHTSLSSLTPLQYQLLYSCFLLAWGQVQQRGQKRYVQTLLRRLGCDLFGKEVRDRYFPKALRWAGFV